MLSDQIIVLQIMEVLLQLSEKSFNSTENVDCSHFSVSCDVKSSSFLFAASSLGVFSYGSSTKASHKKANDKQTGLQHEEIIQLVPLASPTAGRGFSSSGSGLL